MLEDSGIGHSRSGKTAAQQYENSLIAKEKGQFAATFGSRELPIEIFILVFYVNLKGAQAESRMFLLLD